MLEFSPSSSSSISSLSSSQNSFVPAKAKSVLLMTRAFTLIETTLAIGIVSFAFVAIMGLMPIGLMAFRRAMDASTSSRIVQQVVADFQQGTNTLSPQPILYFDDQGDRQTVANGQVTYYVNTAVQSPTTLPGGQSTNLATVTVEIVKNPQNKPLELASGSVIERPGLSISRSPVFIATKNQ